MTRPLSRKASIELFDRSDEKTRKTLLTCVNNDIVNAFRYLQSRLLFVGEEDFEAVQAVLNHRDFPEMLTLHRNITKTAHAIEAYEKHIRSITNME